MAFEIYISRGLIEWGLSCIFSSEGRGLLQRRLNRAFAVLQKYPKKHVKDADANVAIYNIKYQSQINSLKFRNFNKFSFPSGMV